MYVAHHRRRLVCSLEEWTSGEPGIDLVPVTHRLEPHVFEDLDRLPSRGGRRTSRRLSDPDPRVLAFWGGIPDGMGILVFFGL